MSISKQIILILTIITILLTSACRPEGSVAHKNLEKVTVDDQKKIGEAIKDEIYSNTNHFTVLNNGAYKDAYDYINTFLKTILYTENVSRRNALDWDITILEDDNKHSIFVVPGGHIFVYTGFLKFIHNESELLSTIAHEIYYANYDDSVNELFDMVDNAGNVFGDIVLGNEVAEIREIAILASELTFTEEAIANADEFALNLICPFQYDSRGLAEMMKRAKTSDFSIEWFELRPLSDNRIQKVMTMTASCGVEEPTETDRYNRFKDTFLPE